MERGRSGASIEGRGESPTHFRGSRADGRGPFEGTNDEPPGSNPLSMLFIDKMYLSIHLEPRETSGELAGYSTFD